MHKLQHSLLRLLLILFFFFFFSSSLFAPIPAFALCIPAFALTCRPLFRHLVAFRRRFLTLSHTIFLTVSFSLPLSYSLAFTRTHPLFLRLFDPSFLLYPCSPHSPSLRVSPLSLATTYPWAYHQLRRFQPSRHGRREPESMQGQPEWRLPSLPHWSPCAVARL